jgi:integrase
MACIRKWRNRWVVDWRDPSGKRFIEAVADKTAAENRLVEVITSGKAPASKRETFREVAEAWLQSVVKGSIKESTLHEYTSALTNHIYPAFGNTPFTKVARDSIRALIAAKKAEGLSQGTIRNIISPVRSLFFHMMDEGKAHRNPAERIGKLNRRSKDEPTKKINPLARDEIRVMLATAMSKRYIGYYPVFLCAVRAGLRQGELVALKGIDIDFNSRFIHVRRNLSHGRISVTKNGKDRKVDMSKQLAGVLGELLSHRRAEALRREMEKPAEERRDSTTVVNDVMESWLFEPVERFEKRGRRPVARYTQVNPASLRRTFEHLLADAGLRRVRFHDLRHSFASLLLQNGESVTYVKEQMGHSSIQITVDVYGHLVPGGNRSAVDRLDDDAAAETKRAG